MDSEPDFFKELKPDLTYVYVDYTNDGRPFYVGKGTRKRVMERARNQVWKNIVAKHGWSIVPGRQIFFVTRDENAAFDLERSLIVELRTQPGIKGNWGANLTSGGDGVQGRKLSAREKEHLRVINTGPYNPNWGVKGAAHWRTGKPGPNRGKRFSAETREKQKQAKLGERHWRTTLTWQDVKDIRERYASTDATYTEIAKDYGVSKSAICFIVIRRTWKEVPEI